MVKTKKPTTATGGGLDSFIGQPKPATPTKPTPAKGLLQEESQRSIYINTAVAECEKYVPGRKRCDSRDPTGINCVFIVNCAMRDKRFTHPQ
jgi:hypothetical protein